jgi:hypothetical protein
MARIDPQGHEMWLTLVVWGARRSGKSALLGVLRDRLSRGQPGRDVTPALTEPLLDWLPLDLGVIGEWRVHLDLYAVGAGPHHDMTRRLLLRDADGLLVVADSQAARFDDNVEMLQRLDRGLTGSDGQHREPPRVFCYSKQDLPDELIFPPERLAAALGAADFPGFGADLLRGKGALDPLHALVTRVLRRHAGRPAGEG